MHQKQFPPEDLSRINGTEIRLNRAEVKINAKAYLNRPGGAFWSTLSQSYLDMMLAASG